MHLPPGILSTEDLVFWTLLHRGGQYLTLACAVFLICEWFNTIEWEIAYIWRKPFLQPSKALFLLNRYLAIACCTVRAAILIHPHPNESLCQQGLSFTNFSGMIVVVTVEVILMLRVWAIYGRSRTIGILLCLIFCCGITGSLTVYLVQIPPFTFLAAIPPPNIHPCPNSPPTTFFLIFFIGSVSEALCFYLLVRKAWSISQGSQTPLISTLLLHGVIYFSVAFASFTFTVLAQLIQVLAPPTQYSDFSVALASAACSRLILSLQNMHASASHKHQFELTPLSGTDDALTGLMAASADDVVNGREAHGVP